MFIREKYMREREKYCLIHRALYKYCQKFLLDLKNPIEFQKLYKKEMFVLFPSFFFFCLLFKCHNFSNTNGKTPQQTAHKD